MDILLRRLATYAALAAGFLGAILALIGCAVAVVVGAGLNPAQVAGIAAATALAFALLARFLVRRIPWLWVASEAGRRIWARRGRRPPR